MTVESSPPGTGKAVPSPSRVDTAAMQTPSVLRIEHMSKTFPGTKALDNVALEIGPGEIHALVGQNGSGKSTLIKVLAGYHPADRGSRVWLNGEPLEVSHADASHHRLRFVHQDLGLFLELNAVDNLALRGEFLLDPLHRVKWKAQAELTRELVSRFDLDLDVTRPMSEATPVQRTVVAIAAALAGWDGGAGVLVLDEPTAVLPPHDVERLLEIVERVRSRGTSILYVSHRLDEVFRLADRVTVLRGGRAVASRSTEGLNPQLLAELMVGSDVDTGYRADLPAKPAETDIVLRACDLRGRFLEGVDVELREGEILGVAGLPGSGRNELPYAIAGALKGATGTLELRGAATLPLKKAQSLDIPIVPADRAREAMLEQFTVAENISVSVLDRVSRRGFVRRGAERELVGRWMENIEVKRGSERSVVTTLSGGNQQKVIMARCLARDPRVLLLCEPTAGVDVGTRQAIYEFIAERAKAGLSLIVSSSDTGDLLAICTRVLVMCNGRAVRELVGDEITEQALIHAMEETEQV